MRGAAVLSGPPPVADPLPVMGVMGVRRVVVPCQPAACPACPADPAACFFSRARANLFREVPPPVVSSPALDLIFSGRGVFAA